MPLDITVYVTVIGVIAWALFNIAWAYWKNRTEPESEVHETVGNR